MLTEDELVETMEKERHRTLKVWRDAVALARDIYAHTATFPPEERCRPCGPGWGPHCRPGDWWGRGGRNFWPGFIGGVVGGIACNAVAAPYYRDTVVVSSPTVVTQPADKSADEATHG